MILNFHSSIISNWFEWIFWLLPFNEWWWWWWWWLHNKGRSVLWHVLHENESLKRIHKREFWQNKCGFKNHFAVACFTPRGAATRRNSYTRTNWNSNNRGRQNYNYGRRKFYKNKKVEAETDNQNTETVDPNALASLLARSCAISN